MFGDFSFLKKRLAREKARHEKLEREHNALMEIIKQCVPLLPPLPLNEYCNIPTKYYDKFTHILDTEEYIKSNPEFHNLLDGNGESTDGCYVNSWLEAEFFFKHRVNKQHFREEYNRRRDID